MANSAYTWTDQSGKYHIVHLPDGRVSITWQRSPGRMVTVFRPTLWKALRCVMMLARDLDAPADGASA